MSDAHAGGKAKSGGSTFMTKAAVGLVLIGAHLIAQNVGLEDHIKPWLRETVELVKEYLPHSHAPAAVVTTAPTTTNTQPSLTHEKWCKLCKGLPSRFQEPGDKCSTECG